MEILGNNKVVEGVKKGAFINKFFKDLYNL